MKEDADLKTTRLDSGRRNWMRSSGRAGVSADIQQTLDDQAQDIADDLLEEPSAGKRSSVFYTR
jgi:hypothetical protein